MPTYLHYFVLDDIADVFARVKCEKMSMFHRFVARV